MPEIGQLVGNYRLVRLLGEGSFADVYLGQHVQIQHLQTAIKFLHARLSQNYQKEFLQEAEILARLKHPHIIRILDFGIESTENIPYLIMDYASLGTLRNRHAIGRSVPLETVTSYVTQITDALQYAHDRNLIHRDLKPENLLVGEDQEILLSDFGIASVAHSTSSLNTSMFAGTASYSAPEQIMGKARRESDQYALGIIVYEWLTGNRPFQGTLPEIFMQHLGVQPLPLRKKVPAISPAVEAVVMKALTKDPKDRFASVKDFANALEQASCIQQPGGSDSVTFRNPLPYEQSVTQPATLSSKQQVFTPNHTDSQREDIMQNVSVARRPLGITIITILLFTQAVFENVVGILMITNPLSGLLVGWIPLAVGILLFILAWGLWTLKPWSYWGTLVLEIVNIILHFLGYGQTHSLFAIISGGIISIIIVIYLLVDHNVRRVFQTPHSAV